MPTSLPDQIVDMLRASSDGVSSQSIAEQFLKLKMPNPALAHRAVAAILGTDRRCACGDGRLWRPVQIVAATNTHPLSSAPWVAVHLLTSASGDRRQVHHVSLREVESERTVLLSEWLVDPARLSVDDRESLGLSDHQSVELKDRAAVVASAAVLLDERVPLYASSYHQSLLAMLCAQESEQLNDTAMTLRRLASAAGMDASVSGSLESLHTELLGAPLRASRVDDYGGAVAECARELLAVLARAGIETMEALEVAEIREVKSFDFTGKAFGFDDVMKLPEAPGVYAFGAKDGAYLYIGKSTNVRARVSGYFRDSTESPAKLERLRTESHSLTVHPCGSELESLIYEYRLINKHKPLLNTQAGINERAGTFAPINDCIILLPHTDQNKGMSFWFRRNQKVAIKPFLADGSERAAMAPEMETFFFSDKLPPAPDDFPEQEIVFRWVKRHLDDLAMVPVSTLASAQEAWDAMIGLWAESGRG